MRNLTGLFLGAGASYEAGMPLVWDLTTEIKRWLTPEKLRKFNHSWRMQGGGHPDEVIESFASMLLREDAHYEAILGYLETQYLRHQPHQQHYHGLYTWLVQMVWYFLYDRHVRNIEFLKNNLSQYEGIKFLVEQNNPLWVFSLNHDLIVEALAAAFDIPLRSGFSDREVTIPRRDTAGKKTGDLRAQVLAEDELTRFHFPNPPVGGIYLLKIHGALDVFAFNDGKDILKLLPDVATIEGVVDTLRIVHEEVFYPIADSPNGKVNTVNEIAYQDDAGEMQFLRRSILAGAYKFSDRRSQVLPKELLGQFKANLNFLTELVCIGYGFGDLHINAVIREWLEFSSDRKLRIVNPANMSVPAFLLHLAPQVEFFTGDTTSYLDSVSSIIRSEKEILQKRFAKCVRRIGPERLAREMESFHQAEFEKSLSNLSLEEMTALAKAAGGGLVTELISKEPFDADTEARFAGLVKHLESIV